MKKDPGKSSWAAVILAAGAATRMGKLKQLLRYGDETLLQHAIGQALAAGLEPVIVVVGAEADPMRSSIANQPVEVVENRNWKAGMGSSIAVGVERLQHVAPEPTGSFILLADQPLVKAKHFIAMVRAAESTEAAVIAAEYSGTVGVPAIFKRELFGRLEKLEPEMGARHLLRHPRIDVMPFTLPEAAVDVDTPEDFARLAATL